jgi:hypothetical protein
MEAGPSGDVRQFGAFRESLCRDVLFQHQKAELLTKVNADMQN